MRKEHMNHTSRMRERVLENTTQMRRRIDDMCIKVRDWIKELAILEAIEDIVRRNKVLAALAVFAVTSSLVGYVIGGLSFINALYAAAALFFVNPVDECNNVLVLVGKYLSLIVIAGAVLHVVSFVFKRVNHYRINQKPDSTAVYTDNAWGEKLSKKLKNGYISEKREHGGLENAKYHIFMYTDDMANLDLYTAHREELQKEGAHVYIMLNHTDAFLLQGEAEGKQEGPRYFNLYDMLAREYWRQYSLYNAVKKAKGETIEVAIIGYGEVGQAICKYAVLNNVYRLNQSIEYHVWGCKPYQAAFLEGIDLMMGDRIIAEKGDAMDDLARIASMDRVIITEKDDAELLQQLLYVASDAELYCYNDRKVDLSQLYAYGAGRLISFGNMEALLTEENIKQESLYEKAKLLNYDYVLQKRSKKNKISSDVLPPDYRSDMDNEWRKLSGFHKGSNIARADHLWIEEELRKPLIAKGASKEDMRRIEKIIGKLEHIRWCRFHFYNHWSYDPSLGDKKDPVHRRHGLLGKEVKEGQEGKDSVFNKIIRDRLQASD